MEWLAGVRWGTGQLSGVLQVRRVVERQVAR